MIISNTEPVVIGVHEEEAVPLVRAKTKGVAFNEGDNGGEQDKLEEEAMDFDEDEEEKEEIV